MWSAHDRSSSSWRLSTGRCGSRDDHVIVHTGQHYDPRSRSLLRRARIPPPAVIWRSAPAARGQTAAVLAPLDRCCGASPPTGARLWRHELTLARRTCGREAACAQWRTWRPDLRSFNRRDAGGAQPGRHRPPGRSAARAHGRGRGHTSAAEGLPARTAIVGDVMVDSLDGHQRVTVAVQPPHASPSAA